MKDFRLKFKECVDSGNHIEVTEEGDFYFIEPNSMEINKNTWLMADRDGVNITPIFKFNSIGICIKYKRICSSAVCVEERKKE